MYLANSGGKGGRSMRDRAGRRDPSVFMARAGSARSSLDAVQTYVQDLAVSPAGVQHIRRQCPKILVPQNTALKAYNCFATCQTLSTTMTVSTMLSGLKKQQELRAIPGAYQRV